MRIMKRDGKLQPFDASKIMKAVLAAFNDVQPGNIPDLSSIVESICTNLREHFSDIVPIQAVHSEVEQTLGILYPDVGAAYKGYRENRDKARLHRQVYPGSGMIAEYIHRAKYARYLPEQQRRETFDETVTRVKNMHSAKYSQTDAITKAFEDVYAKRVLPSMRSMQFAGIAIENHNARMYNCSFTLVNRPEVFGQVFYLLLCGCGVGYSVQFQHVEELPAMIGGKKVKHTTISDTIEGWADAVTELVRSYIEGYYAEFDYTMIRPEGSPLKTSGGKAPGHIGLKKLLEKLRLILDIAQGRQLRPIECHDMICHIAEAVLAGGIRRSSLIALFSSTDGEMTYCKSRDHFSFSGSNSQRAMANNSVVFKRDKTTQADFMRLMRINKQSFGEPGFVFVKDLDEGTNPCGEIGLYPKTMDGHTGFGFCNLVEINVAACKTEEVFFQACWSAGVIATLQAGYTKFPYLGWVTESIVRRDALIGVGLTGIMDNPAIGLNSAILKSGAAVVLDANKHTADLIGIKTSARCTTVKPGGTAPLELGCVSCGIHPHHARRYFRRVTANPNETVAQYFRSVNPQMVETKPNGDWCITFPVEVSSEAITLKNLTSSDFLADVLLVYDNWIRGGMRDKNDLITHNVSTTIVVEEKDWDEILKRVWENRESIKAITFLPAASDKGIPYCPREEVSTEADEMKWNYLLENYKAVDYEKMVEKEGTVGNVGLEPACGGGSCGL